MLSDDKQYIESNYSDIISKKNGYKQVDFKKFLIRHFNRQISLVDNSNLTKKLQNKFPKEYSDIHKTYFINYGHLQTLPIQSLDFYQSYVGIEGPKFHLLNDPVFVVKEKDRYILWEGYHRILIKMINKENLVSSYIISI